MILNLKVAFYSMFKLIDNKFSITSKSSTVQKEITAGFTTFITMAYIIIVNPMMMSSAGMDYGASFVGTCLAAATLYINGVVYTNSRACSWNGSKCFFYIHSSW